MAGFIYTPSSSALPGGDNARIGKIATAVMMIVKRESDLLTKKKGVAEWLYNVENSYHAEEAIVTESNFGDLSMVEDGGVKELLSKQESQVNTIRHFELSGQFIAQAAMLEDSINVGGISSQLRRFGQEIAETYYRSRNVIAGKALAAGLGSTLVYKGRSKPLVCADGKPLFANDHTVGVDGDTQGNLFYNTRANGVGISSSMIVDILGHMAIKGRNMLDENGYPMGFNIDTVVIPSNTPNLEMALKTALASQSTSTSTGAMSGDSNIQYDNWNLVVLHTWQASNVAHCPMIFLSSEANRQLSGNMFFDRTKFMVNHWVDNPTSNYCVSGRARIGIGWGSYKHALYFESIANGTSTITNGDTAATVGTSVTL